MAVTGEPRSGRRSRRSEAGASLMMILVFIMVAGLAVSSLVAFTAVNLRSTRSYEALAERTQDASDAIDSAIALARTDGTKGLDGDTYTMTYQGAVATCTGMAGSGAPAAVGRADRTIECKADVNSRRVMTVTARMIDQRGDNPGAAVEVLSRSVSG